MNNLPNFPNIKILEKKPDKIEIDYEEIRKLNDILNNNLYELREVNFELTKIEREKTKIDLKYKRKYRTEYLKNTDSKNENQRKILTEIECEELESKSMYYEELVRELNRKSMEIRTAINVLNTIGFNIRQELKL